MLSANFANAANAVPRSSPLPALKVTGLDGELEPLTIEKDLFEVCKAHGVTGELARIVVPRDKHRFAYNRVNPHFDKARGFALLCFRSNLAAAAAMTKLKHLDLKYKGCVVQFVWDNRASERAAAAAAAERPIEKVVDPGLVNCLDFPGLPRAAPARAPVFVSKPEVHIVRSTPPSSTAGSDTASNASTAAGQACRYCKVLGHFARECPQLSTRLCKTCGLFGHTEKLCPIAAMGLYDEVPTTAIFEGY